METEDLIKLPASSSSGSENENNRVHDSGCEPSGGDSLPANSGVREDGEDGRIPGTVSILNEDNKCLLACSFDEDMDISPLTSPVCAESTETGVVTERVTCLSSEIHAENGFATVEEGKSLGNHKEGASFTRSQDNATGKCSLEPDACASSKNFLATDIALAGTKRTRATVDEQPSVRVVYNSLTRESRQKLEELLHRWSQWHARHCTSSNDSSEVLESGEGTYFLALDVGLDKASTVSFWMDDQTKVPLRKDFIPLDGNSVPVYDRGFSSALASTDDSGDLERRREVLDTRCFNCGSYSHSLKECPKPRDNVAVSNARKQHKSGRNQNASSRSTIRYYESSPKGKFDGLRPGILDAETRRLLGLGELDPPPWLNRMREIGYPPGYLEPEDEDQPSGITIFADEETEGETEEGEILDAGILDDGCVDPPKKMSVEFPGINAPIPENADRWRWEAASSSANFSRHHSYRRYDHSLDSIGRGRYYEQTQTRDYVDDGPPGCDLRSSPSWSSYSIRYGSYDSNYTTPDTSVNSSGRRSPSFGRSFSGRKRRSPHNDYSNRGVYGSLP